ncbi:unnamed protein product [Spodoptera exigua]|nr:unnamed protein product [Spodoptera exigua]
MDQEYAVHYLQGCFHCLNPRGIPSHSLKLKIGAPLFYLEIYVPGDCTLNLFAIT